MLKINLIMKLKENSVKTILVKLKFIEKQIDF